MTILDKLKQICEIKENKSLAPLTTFNIGGHARYFCEVKKPEQIFGLIKICEKSKLSYFILGGGSNVLFSDDGFDGLVIRIISQRLSVSGQLLECGAGLSLSKLIGESVGAGLTGLEWAIGIPGTVGGAVVGNAGAYGGEISDNIKEVMVLRRSKERIIKKKKCNFSYRASIFKEESNQDIIWSVIFELKKGNIVQARDRMKNILKKREEKFEINSAGSFFKNILMDKKEIKEFKNKFLTLPDEFIKWGKIPAGWLIDQCGFKGEKIGGAMVSPQHAGIIINAGNAKASEVIELAELIKKKAKEKFGLELEEEVKIVGTRL